MRGKFFNAIFYLFILILVTACKPTSDFFSTTDYIKTVKNIEINSPDYNSKDMISIENLVYGFLKVNYSEVRKEDIKWEELGNLDNGKLIKASFKDAFVEIRANKNGDFIEILPIELDFRDKNGDRYNILNVPFKNITDEASVPNNISINTNYNSSIPNEDYNTTSNEDNSYPEYSKKFGKVVNDKYVGGSLIQFIKNADNIEEYEYLKEQFFEILDTMYVTKDKETYYYLNDIITNIANKADTDLPAKIELNVEGKKLYFIVAFPKDFGANTPSWVEFEIFEREFKDGLALRTAHVSCAINGVEYKDWEAIEAIYK